MDKFEEFYKQHCLDHFGYDPDLNWIFEKHEDGSYIQIEVENAKKVYQHQQAKVCSLEEQVEELQKRVEWLENRLKATDTLSKMRAAVIGSFKTQEFNARTRIKMMILKKAEQVIKEEEW